MIICPFILGAELSGRIQTYAIRSSLSLTITLLKTAATHLNETKTMCIYSGVKSGSYHGGNVSRLCNLKVVIAVFLNFGHDKRWNTSPLRFRPSVSCSEFEQRAAVNPGRSTPN
jgi:hypothetical protein